MFDFKRYLNERRISIDKALDKSIPPASCKPSILHRAMRYSVFSGGKRIRPILCLAAAEAVGASPGRAILPAVAIELLHTYTLIHDDLPCMDDDDFRRGKPTSHRVFGEANAILTGDALQALAFEILARTSAPAPYPPNQLVRELASAAGSTGVVGGQVEDLALTGRRQTIELVEFIHLHKTADIFSATLRMGGIAGGVGRKQLAALTKYGTNIGLAFQITDDLIDANSSRKAENSRKKRSELSCLSVLTPEKARKKAKTLVIKAISAISKRNFKVSPLVAMAQLVMERAG